MAWKLVPVALLGLLVACGGDASAPDVSADSGRDVPVVQDPGPVDPGPVDPGQDDAIHPEDAAELPDTDADDPGTSDDPGGDAPAVCIEPADLLDLAGVDLAYVTVAPTDPFLVKNAYLLELFEAVPEYLDVVRSGDLGALGAERVGRFLDAVGACADRDCVITAVAWTPEEIASAGDLLAQALVGVDGGPGIVGDHLRPSGRFHLHRDLSDADLLKAAWNDTMTASEKAMRRFANEAGPDSTDAAIATVHVEVESVDPSYRRPHLVLGALFQQLATAAGRDEAARYEPMETGENAAALARIPDIDWDAYPYTVILVPGWGPTDLETPLSTLGAEHCDLAVLRWQAGWAPFIAVSGGHVHPNRTPYAEAIEMKGYLMETHGVPEDAILVDPHARHTTTNLRNVGRLVFRYGIPPERPLVTTTDFLQSAYITALGGRCMDELGYLPWRAVNALTLEDNCLYVSPDVLHADPRDPLDP